MSVTHGGRARQFKWFLRGEHLVIENESGLTHTYSTEEILAILSSIHTQFGDQWFSLANNVEKIYRGTETQGLGTTIYRLHPGDILHAQGASYLGVVLDEVGILEWNGRSRGISWRLVFHTIEPGEIRARLSRHASSTAGGAARSHPRRPPDGLGDSRSSRAFEKEYDEEGHLFNVVGPRFRETGQLSVYDFFLIVRWKANRAISKVAARLLTESGLDLDQAVSRLSHQIHSARDAQERFLVLVRDWHFRLPMASAILAVLYPDEFTVYDVRACDQVGGFQTLPQHTSPEALWRGYLEFKTAVERATPPNLSLRDKDRFLWARSRHEDLVAAIRRRFGVVK